MSCRRTYAAVTLCFVAIFATNVFACRIPVFRYALERWPPGTFELVILNAGELTPEQSALIQSAKDSASDANNPVNLRVTSIDVSSDAISANDRALIGASGIDLAGLEGLRAALLFPRMRAHTTVAWRGEFTKDSISRLLDSPQRQQIVEKLLNGESAVWVLIDGPDAASNDAAADLLETELGRVSELIKLPNQEALESDEEFQAGVTVELRIGFSLQRIRRDDPQESAFVQMLLNSESDLTSFNEPIAIPVFGRGRTYYALVGKGITPDLIEENCRFICGDCSCQVKEENPGSDLLVAANWDEGIRGSAIPPQHALPELTGIGSLDVIDLADYERKVTTVPGAPSSVEIHSNAPGKGAADKGEFAETELAKTGIAESRSHTDSTQEEGTSKTVISTTVESTQDLDTQVTSPLWLSLLPIVGLALIVGIAGMFLLRS